MFDDYGITWFNPEEEKGKEIEEEISGPGGMIYSVPKTIQQYKDFLKGFQGSFFHNDTLDVGNQCMTDDIQLGIEWSLEYIYKPHNFVHFLDLFKFTNELLLVFQNILSNCGIKHMFLGLTQFCETDPVRCSLPVILSNVWWRMGIIAVLAMRIFSNDIELIVYAAEKDEDPDAANESAETMQDMGEDFGTILKYIIDFRSDMDTTRSEFDMS